MTANELKFQTFKNKWLKEINEPPLIFSSNPNDLYTASYLDIIGMKYEALPCILNELVKEGDKPNDWFFALAIITHFNPVPRELRGNRKEMAKKWIEWGYEKGIIKPNVALESLKKEIKEKFNAPAVKEKAKTKATKSKKTVAKSKKI